MVKETVLNNRKKLRDKAEQHIRSYPPIKIPAKTLIELLDELDRVEQRLAVAHQKIGSLESELVRKSGYNGEYYD
jgi:hypothetical protein